MPRQFIGMNKHQKASRRLGEKRVGRQELQELLQLSRSSDPADRAHAAEFMCPCHVRKRVDEVWEALYRMLEDDDLAVRKAAWHTLEDGGKPDDPALEEIIQRALTNEPNAHIRNFARSLADNRQKKEQIRREFAVTVGEFDLKGKCDFCGASTKVKRDYDTLIPERSTQRAALVCQNCL